MFKKGALVMPAEMGEQSELQYSQTDAIISIISRGLAQRRVFQPLSTPSEEIWALVASISPRSLAADILLADLSFVSTADCSRIADS